MSSGETPLVAIVSGSDSDAEMVHACQQLLDGYGIAHESRVISAHRQPQMLRQWVAEVVEKGAVVFIALAGMAAHLPGVVASLTARPVLGVPLPGGLATGIDALYSVVQMPAGVPVGTLAVGKAGAKNAAHLAARILALQDPRLAEQVEEFRRHMAQGGR